MQRLSLLLVGLITAWLGARLAGGAESFAPYYLRDALLLSVLGGLIFALNAQGWRAPPVFRRLRGLPRPGQLLLLTGLIVSLAGGAGLAAGLAGIGGMAATIAWWLGLVLQVAGAWWPGAAVDYARPQVRWSRDAAGNFVPLPAGVGDDSAAGRRALGLQMGRRALLAWLLVILIAAAFLRFWNLDQLPPGCINQECDAALHLTQGIQEDGPPGSPPAWKSPFLDASLPRELAELFVYVTGAGVLSLRLAAATLGWLTVLVLAGALQRLVGRPAALLGTALLAISPWHIWASRSSDPWIPATLLAAVTLWLGLEALARTHARWWVAWGIAAGLLAAQAPQLWPGIALWAAATGSLGLAQGWRRRGHVGEHDLWLWPLAGLGAALGAGLPAVAGAVSSTAVPMPAGDVLAANLGGLASAALRPELSIIGPFLGAGLVNGLLLALAVAGCGALLRHLRQPQAGIVLIGAASLLGAAALLNMAVDPPGSVLLAALPLLLALAAVALDRVLAALVRAWGPPLVPAARLAGAMALIVLLIAGRGTATLMLGLDTVSGGAGTAVEIDMARYIGEWFRQAPAVAPDSPLDSPLDNPTGAQTTFVVPDSVIDHPSVQLLAGPALADGRVQPLELGRTLPYAGLPAGDVVYLLPVLDTETIDLLRQLYPAGEATTELDAEGKRPLFNRFSVRRQDLTAAQTIQMTVTPAGTSKDAGTEGAGSSAFNQPLAVAGMDFPWSAMPPRALPFTVEWNGSLVLPESGSYRFAVDSTGPESTFTLLVDDILLLDSSLAMNDQQLELPQGIHRLKMAYRSGNRPGNLRVYWTPPGGNQQILGAPALHSPLLADQGLYGDYYDNDRFEGSPVATHRDPIIGLDPGLSQPYSVRWYGMLAAPRSGEYLIGADAGGSVQLIVDGQTLADNRGGGAASPGGQSSYTEGLIYLPAGWHPIEVRFTPQAKAPTQESGAAAGGQTGSQASSEGTGGIAPGAIRLVWQPPGSMPGDLSSRYLLPTYGSVEQTDVALPPAPPLADAALGDDSFALTQAADVWHPHLRIPPANLPPLPLERLWQIGGACGSERDQLAAPHGAAFSPAGDKLYVADTGNRRVVVYSVDGALETVITGDALQEPVDVGVAADGALLILDAAAQGVFRLEAGGELAPIPLQTGFYHPRGLGLDNLGNMAVADTGGGRVAIVEPDGTQAGQFGGQGSLLGRGQPVDALAAEGVLWAISAEDGRLWNLHSGGSMTVVQPTGTVDGPQLAELADGRLLVSDPARSTFLLLAASGQPLSQFAYAGELATPTGIAATRIGDGNIIGVADTRACTLSVWRLAQ